MTHKNAFVLALAVLVGLVSLRAAAQDTRPPRVQVSGVSDGQLLTLGDKIYARVPPDSAGVEFLFQPETTGDVRMPPIALGTDYGHMEPTFGPDCGADRCEKRAFSVALDRQLARHREGWGQLTVREIGTGEESSVRVYWDATPPVAPFRSPQFNASLNSSGKYQVIAHTLDEDIVSLKVHWALTVLNGRDIPEFEQHFLGYDFAQHAACVPTSVGANLQWLQDTGQADVVNPVFAGDNKALVTALGKAMQTTTSGTGGNDARDGTAFFLFFTTGLLAGQDYTLEHTGGGNGQYGFTPQQMLEEFQAGGAISVGFHNLSSDPSFGHFLTLSNVTLNDDGTAWIRVMDPNVEPNPGGQTTGEFRSFKLHTNGKIDWTAANPGYYSPPSGKVKLDELLILRDFTSPGFMMTSSLFGSDAVPMSGDVQGTLTEGGHTFVGTFEPPPGSPGPWLLISESTQRSGHTQKSYRYVGGRSGERPPDR
jgi:hypothetical protein